MPPLFHLQGVTHFYNQVCALRDIDLQMPPGAIGLVGQNGAGKSTMMQILLGLIRPSKGSASVLGMDVGKAGVALRGRVGFMPERESVIPGLKGLEYAALAGELCGMSRRQALRRAHETLTYLGMEEARYRLVEQYSVGMKQRLKLAATLVHDPQVLLLDEPTSGLDPEGRADMLALLSALASRAGKSLILSSHLLGDIERVCTSAIILNQGRLVSAGRLEELKIPRQRCYRVRWLGDANGMLDDIRESGGTVQRHEDHADEARLLTPDDWSTRTLFEAAHRHGVAVTELEPEEENLETVYHRVIKVGAVDDGQHQPANETERT